MSLSFRGSGLGARRSGLGARSDQLLVFGSRLTRVRAESVLAAGSRLGVRRPQRGWPQPTTGVVCWGRCGSSDPADLERRAQDHAKRPAAVPCGGGASFAASDRATRSPNRFRLSRGSSKPTPCSTALPRRGVLPRREARRQEPTRRVGPAHRRVTYTDLSFTSRTGNFLNARSIALATCLSRVLAMDELRGSVPRSITQR